MIYMYSYVNTPGGHVNEVSRICYPGCWPLGFTGNIYAPEKGSVRHQARLPNHLLPGLALDQIPSVHNLGASQSTFVVAVVVFQVYGPVCDVTRLLCQKWTSSRVCTVVHLSNITFGSWKAMSWLLARLACTVLNQKVNMWVMVLIQQRPVRGAASVLLITAVPFLLALLRMLWGLCTMLRHACKMWWRCTRCTLERWLGLKTWRPMWPVPTWGLPGLCGLSDQTKLPRNGYGGQ